MEQLDLYLSGDRVSRAIALLRANEPPDGYYLAFSGGKDSIVCKRLLEMSGCKYDSHYNQTTIDPPELVRFIRKCHGEVEWNKPKQNMWTMVATAPKVPPTRRGRWCCEVYKEHGGDGRLVVIGVRAAESKSRASNWGETGNDVHGHKVVCPVVSWSDTDVWDFIRMEKIPYCSLYDEGFERLGCVGCPLSGVERQTFEFSRWPLFERNWHNAIVANWEKWHNERNTRTGEYRYQHKFESGERFWEWWRYNQPPDPIRGDCQSGLLWTNEDVSDLYENLHSSKP